MAITLRDLLIERAARLQERPAVTAPEWGTLSYAQLRQRAEGVALGLLAAEPGPKVHSALGNAWDWAAELAAAASGLQWDPAGWAVPPEVLGGARFNAEAGRGPYHAREQSVLAATPFTARLDHGQLLDRLRRLNRRLGWDHEHQERLPLRRLGQDDLRAALWSALYAGAHAVLVPAGPSDWNAGPFLDFW